MLKSREIENLLTPKTISKVVYFWLKDSLDIEEFDENLFDADQEDYQDVYLGSFIHEQVGDEYGAFAEKKNGARQGTIYPKVKFATSAISFLHKWDDLSPEAKILTIKVYEFIKARNE